MPPSRFVDPFGRFLDYVRISITDRCPFRCRYCYPHEPFSFIPHERILRYEDLLYLLSLFPSWGIRKVRITGGEPLVRKGVLPFLGKATALFPSLYMTTNGYFLKDTTIKGADGKEVKEFDGKEYILERGIVADLAIVKAWKADATGNAIFRKTARNFNVPAAKCGRVCVLEVEEIVPTGSLDPDAIHLPGIYVHRIIQGPHEKRIEQRTTRKKESA